MPNWSELFARLRERFATMSNSRRALLIGGIIALFITGGTVIYLSSQLGTTSLLYKSPLSPEDYARVTAALQDQRIDFDTRGDQYILVRDENTAKNVRMRLGQSGIIPQSVRGWELFDVQRFTTTDFERDVNLRRAIIGEMTKHLKTLGDVEDVSIQVSFPDDRLYSDAQIPVTASVVVTPAPYTDLAANKAKVQGIVNLVAYGIPELSAMDVVVVDNRGNVLSDILVPNEADEQVKMAREQLRVTELERARYTARVSEALSRSLPKDRYLVSADIEFNWNVKSSTTKELIPTVIKPDNPMTPYDDSEQVLEVLVSEDRVDETYRGPSYIPEGPAGVEDNIPPGLKDKIDRFNTYEREQVTRNVTTGTRDSFEKNAPYSIKRVTVSVAIDGMWSILRHDNGTEVISNGSIQREFTPVDASELRSYQDIVQAAVGYNPARQDQVTVTSLRFDRTSEFALEDGLVRRRMMMQRIFLLSMLSLAGLIILIILFRLLSTAIEVRRKRREEQRIREQDAAREAAMRVADAEQASMELSMEDKASNELLEMVITNVREHPQETAKLIRTWLLEN